MTKILAKIESLLVPLTNNKQEFSALVVLFASEGVSVSVSVSVFINSRGGVLRAGLSRPNFRSAALIFDRDF